MNWPERVPGGVLRESRRLRLILLASLLVLISIFVTVVETARQSLDPNVIQAKLFSEGRLIQLPEWEMALFDCPGGTVDDDCVAGPRLTVTFPLASSVLGSFSQLATGRALAVVTAQLAPEPRRWISAHSELVLVMPRSVQLQVVQTENGVPLAMGIGTPILAPWHAADLLEKGHLALTFDFTGLPSFGPMDLAPALVEPDAVESYVSLPDRQLAANHLLMQLGVGLPMILGVMALVLDHSRPFALLSLYGLSRAARSFLPYLTENKGLEGGWVEPLFYALNGLSFALFLFLVWEISRFSKPRWGWIIALPVTLAAFFVGVGSLLGDGWVTLDLYADVGKSVVGIVLLLLSGLSLMRQRDAAQGVFARGPALDLLALSLLAVALALQAWGNVGDLFHAREGLKSILDWKHIAVFPALTVAALVEVGFTSRKVEAAAREIAEKRLLDREMELAQELQQKSLPARRTGGEFWRCRSIYRPASRLGGDWFDVRELRFSDGRALMVAVLVDVTGHGVAAALSTTIVASVWSQWCEESERGVCPVGDEERKRWLASAPARLDGALHSSRWQGAGTAAFVVLCPSSETLTYCTAGHPPLVLAEDAQLTSLATHNSALGHTRHGEREWQCASRPVQAGQTLVLFSDGIVPQGSTTSGFLAGQRRQFKKGNRGVEVLFGHGFRHARQAFRSCRDQEDDVTLLFIILLPRPA